MVSVAHEWLVLISYGSQLFTGLNATVTPRCCPRCWVDGRRDVNDMFLVMDMRCLGCIEVANLSIAKMEDRRRNDGLNGRQQRAAEGRNIGILRITEL